MNTQHFKRSTLGLSLLPALLLLSLAGCAVRLPPTPPVVVAPPTIPAPPNVTEPLPSGSYWQRHCALMQKVQTTLKLTLTQCARF